MIGSLRGVVLDRDADGELLIEVAGVGYRVAVGPATAVAVGDIGDEVFVWVHHHLREDTQALYGFATRDERVVFEVLLAAHGVGPSLALAILSVHGPDALRQVVAEQDLAALCLVPGVGKKTAARLLVELESKLGEPSGSIDLRAGADSTDGSATVVADLREALEGLGYGTDEIRVVLHDLPTDGDVSELLA